MRSCWICLAAMLSVSTRAPAACTDCLSGATIRCIPRTTPPLCVCYSTSDFPTDTDPDFAADEIERLWGLYTTTFGFVPPTTLPELCVRIVHVPANGCHGEAFWGVTPLVIELGVECFTDLACGRKWAQRALAHELFHLIQTFYDAAEFEWIREGTARTMEDSCLAELDDWPGSVGHACMGSVGTSVSIPATSFTEQANLYLRATNIDLTLSTDSTVWYNSALWWKYFMEQFDKTTTAEPQRGMNALLQLWTSAALPAVNDVAVVDKALTVLAPGTDFNAAFRLFAAANWMKDHTGVIDPMTGLPDLRYQYFDDDCAPATCPAYESIPAIVPRDTSLMEFPVEVTKPGNWLNYPIERYGVAYFKASPHAMNCPVITATFHQQMLSGSGDAFYHVVTRNGLAFKEHFDSIETDWIRSFVTSGITDLAAIVGAQVHSATVDVSLSCADAILEIVLPDTAHVAHVGPATNPGTFLVQVRLTDTTTLGPIAGLANSDFGVKVNGIDVMNVPGGFVPTQEQYWFRVQAPAVPADDLYDLEVTLKRPGTTPVITSDTNLKSVEYGPGNSDQILVVDRSGSMSAGGKMDAAIAAAKLYVDITRNNDGLSVVAFHHDVFPMPLAMGLASANRTPAGALLGLLTPLGATSIGDGLREALHQRSISSTGNARCSIVLLSDGMENSPEFWATVKTSAMMAGCPVTAIAFGPESDEDLMKQIAADTGGLSFYNDVFLSAAAPADGGGGATTDDDMALELGGTYEYSQALGEGRQRLIAQKGVVPAPADDVEQAHPLIIDPSVSEALFVLDWNTPNAEMALRLRRPDGTILDSTTVLYTFQDFTAGHLGWRISNPPPGAWEMLVTQSMGGQSAVAYQVIASGRSNLTFDLVPDRSGVQRLTGQRMPIHAILAAGGPIPDATVVATVTAPDGTETRLTLHDDGQHRDGIPGDGLYGGIYTRVNQASAVAPAEEPDADQPEPKDEGSYRVRALASGPGFQREALGSFTVLEGPDANGDGLPDPFEAEYGVTGSGVDPDLDGLSNLAEYQKGTDPSRSDTDRGGEGDGSESETPTQDPLEPGDDRIEAPAYFTVSAQDGGVALAYDFRPGYDHVLLYRATSPDGPWTLSELSLGEDGRAVDVAPNGQTLHYRFQGVDSSGHRSALLQSGAVTPSVDPIPPAASMIINQGQADTATRDVTLFFVPIEGYLPAFEDITEVFLGNDPSFAGASWRPFTQEIPWELAPVSPGERAFVYARFRDAAGNLSIGASTATVVYSPSVVNWKRCDGNGNAKLDLSDAVWSLNYQFTGGPVGECPAALDCDANGGLNITDPIRLLGILFLGAPQFENFDVCETFEGCPQRCP